MAVAVGVLKTVVDLSMRASGGYGKLDSIKESLQERSPMFKRHSGNLYFMCRFMGRQLVYAKVREALYGPDRDYVKYLDQPDFESREFPIEKICLGKEGYMNKLYVLILLFLVQSICAMEVEQQKPRVFSFFNKGNSLQTNDFNDAVINATHKQNLLTDDQASVLKATNLADRKDKYFDFSCGKLEAKTI